MKLKDRLFPPFFSLKEQREMEREIQKEMRREEKRHMGYSSQLSLSEKYSLADKIMEETLKEIFQSVENDFFH